MARSKKLNERLHTETINSVYYRVVRRPSGTVQIWADYPAGQSAGYPECCYSGTIEGARNAWRRLRTLATHCN